MGAYGRANPAPTLANSGHSFSIITITILTITFTGKSSVIPSGCASQVKRGLEILGIGIVDIDSRDCMMLRAEQTPDKAYLEKQGEDYNLVDWYLDVLRKYKDKLLRITRYVVADAWFSKAKFVGEACLLGFHVNSPMSQWGCPLNAPVCFRKKLRAVL